MAKIADKKIWWASVRDAVSYNVRLIPDGTAFSYEHEPDTGLDHTPDQPEHEVNLAGVKLAEGVYDIFITSVDRGGNESDPLALEDAVLDFTPPAAPSAGGFR